MAARPGKEEPRGAGSYAWVARTSHIDDQYPALVRNNRLRASDLTRLRDEASKFGHRPRMSVVLPIRGSEHREWLEPTLDSALSQVYPDWELCICYDGPAEEYAWETLARYARLDQRIQLAGPEQDPGKTLNAALSRSSGEFVGLLDPGDELSPDALFEVVRLLQEHPEADLVYTDEDRIDEWGERFAPHFKPGWSPDLLFSTDYISRLSICRSSLLEEIGGFREDFEGASGYDLNLRLTERTANIHHVPRVLYHRRTMADSPLSNGSESRSREKGRALSEALKRRGIEGSVEDGLSPGCFRVKPKIDGEPRVSILIPTRDNVSLLSRCIESIERLTSYPNYEVLILNNDSEAPETVEYLSRTPHRVIPFREAFNYSRINNFGVSKVEGEYVLLLNDDTEVIRGEWLEEMLRHAQRPEVGAVGAKLLYPDHHIQHAGVLTGVGHSWGPGIAVHSHQHHPADSPGYMNALNTIRNYTAVTAACMMLRKSVFVEVGGFEEDNLPVSFNDVDLCLRLRERGYRIVYTPYAELYHYESVSRGRGTRPAENLYMRKRWGKVLDEDPYRNPNFSAGNANFDLRADLLRPRLLRTEADENPENPDKLPWEMSKEERDSYLEARWRIARSSCRISLAPLEKTAKPASPSKPKRRGGTVGATDGSPGPHGVEKKTLRAEQLIWIFGSPRTGSTWLSRVMAELEDQDLWHEPYVGLLFGSFVHERLGNNTPLLDSPAFIMGKPHKKVWLESIKNFVLEGAAVRYPGLSEDQYLVVKEPNGSIGASLLLEAMPESRMIFLIRDSRDVVASRLDAFRKGSWSHQNLDYDSPETLNHFTRHLAGEYLRMVSQARKAFEAHTGEKALVRYEDLRDETLGTMLTMYGSLKMEVDRARLEAAILKHDWELIPEDEKGPGKFYRKARSGSWKEDLSAEQIELIEDITAPILSEFYDFDAG